MSAEDISNIADESDFDGPLVDYQAKGNQIELAGKEDVEGKPAYRLKLTSKKGETRSYLFDAASFHLVRWEGIRKVGDKEVPWESLFRDYRDVNGLMFAFEIDSDAPGTEQSQKIIADKIELDPQIDESHFGKPPAPAPPEEPAKTAPPPSIIHLHRTNPELLVFRSGFSTDGGGCPMRMVEIRNRIGHSQEKCDPRKIPYTAVYSPASSIEATRCTWWPAEPHGGRRRCIRPAESRDFYRVSPFPGSGCE